METIGELGEYMQDLGKSWENILGTHHQMDQMGHEGFFPECVARVPVSLWGSGG